MKKLYPLTACLFLLIGIRTSAQTTLSTTSAYSNNNGSGTVTFNLQNTNSSGVIITGIEGVTGTSGNQAVEFWYKPTPISGSPGAISTANGWIQIAAGTINGIANSSTTATQPFFTGLNFLLPANTTYGFAVFATGQRYYTMPGAITTSAGGVNMLAGPNISYGGGTPPAAPSNTPRGWIGKIDFMPALPCTSPPTPGTATASSANVCTGASFQLGLTGNSMGTGQTYQWESSSSPSGPWTSVGPSQTTPTYNATATATLYYRNAVTCGTSTTYSTPVLVTVPALFPAGTYTINSGQPTGGTNFHSFGDAVSAISCGIAGHVVFNVAAGSGPYNEQVVIPAINSSATKTVTFNGNGRTLTYSPTSSNYAVLQLDGADYIRIKRLTVQPGTGSYGYGIVLTNNADNNLIDSCTVNNGTSGTSSLFAGIVVGGSETSATSGTLPCDNNIISNNEVIGGYYCVTSVGTSSALNQGNQFLNNEIRDFYTYGLYLTYNNDLVAEGNELHRENRTNPSTFYGIYHSTGNLGSKISKNRIHDPFGGSPTGSSSAYFLYNTASGTSGNENVFSNNAVYKVNGHGTHYMVYAAGNYGRYYFNTISSDYTAATSGTTYGYYQTSNYTGVEFRNNIMSVTRGGSGSKYLAYHSGSGYAVVMDHNDYYTNATASHFYRAGAIANLAAWKTATGKDAASLGVNPNFFAPNSGDLTPTNLAMDNLGTPVTGITTDIYNITRNATTPDAGAVEFNYPCSVPTNLAATSLLVNGATVSWTLPAVTGGAQYAVTTSATPPAAGTLTAATSVSVTGLTAATQYYLHVRNRCGSATYSSWVSIPFTTCTQAVITPLSALIFCSGSNVTLTANPGTSYVWSLNGSPLTGVTGSAYTTATAGNYTVKVTDAATGCVVTSAPVQVQVSAPPASITPSGAVTACPGVGAQLAAINGVGYTYQWKLNGANIPGATSSTYTALTAGNYTVFVSSGPNCNATTASPTAVSLHPVTPAAIATPQYTAVCPGSSVTLNANTGSGLAYQWQLNGTDIPGATAPSFTGSNAGTYTVEVTKLATGCVSTSAPLNISAATAPAAAISAPAQLTACDTAVLTANAGTGYTYQWVRNGSDIPGATAQTYGAPLSGNYIVRVINSAGCQTASAPVAVTVNPVPNATITYSAPLEFCAGGGVVLNVTPAPGQLYQWLLDGNPIPGSSADNHTADVTGSYAVHVTNSYGCSKLSGIVPVMVHPTPEPQVTFSNDILSTGSYVSYQWFYNNQPVPGATGSTHAPSQRGTYKVTVTDSNGCTGTSEIVFVNSLGVGSNTVARDIKVYPNPATDLVRVEAPVPVDLTLRDVQGKEVLRQPAATSINVQPLAEGVYLLYITDRQGHLLKTEKLVKGH